MKKPNSLTLVLIPLYLSMAVLYAALIAVLFFGCAHVKKGSVDLGVDVAQGVYPSLGVSYPVGPVWVSTGVWGGTDYDGYRAWGPYLSLGWSWSAE